ncbi:hypothetical protein O8I42_01800 [Campylobacter lari]|uniref:hypothetical protein n=1 Tax=Campylobacter lari TaxID=201 RepID=UPI0012720351|nr:hypothetical protein [Campylobacter lari]EAH8152734.1 hypothetical protein [Campylobacter lari]EAI3912740.1 hypothetical protein [Campylobacter lari]EAI4828635.1 hypothetical protein [Campylobacter lari]EAK0440172.1 hypothetical protein [Campylobacter lari]EAK0793921.1 hypothetical protein [Campylobacter lari]
MKLVKINNTYIVAETIKSFRIFQDENFIALEIFNGKKYTEYFEIFQSGKMERYYLFGANQNSKTKNILNDIDILTQKLCEVISNNLVETLALVESIKEDISFRLDDEITEILEKSELVKNIKKLVKEYENEKSNKCFLKIFKGDK